MIVVGFGHISTTAAHQPPLAPAVESSPLIRVPARLSLPPQPSRKSPLELPPPPGGETVNLPQPPMERGDLRFPINLATALRLADARPLIVAAAQASAWSAEGQLQKAMVLWVHGAPITAAAAA
jgi:hypothetical protein